MKKLFIIIASTLAGLILFSYLFFLFGLTKVVNLNNYKKDIQNDIRKQAMLEADLGDLYLKTYPDLSIGAGSNNINIKHIDDLDFLTVNEAFVKVNLISLLFKNIDIREIKLIKPQVYFTKEKNGKFKIENVLKAAQGEQNPKDNAQEAEMDYKPVLSKLKAIIQEYKVTYTDKSLKTPKTLSIAGKTIDLKELNPEKYISLSTAGNLFINNKPNINFDIKLSSDLGFKSNDKDKKTENTTAPADFSAQLDEILKTDIKADILADLKIKNIKNTPNIFGDLNIDKLSLKIDNQRIADSKAHIKFKGEGLSIDSKIFIDKLTSLQVIGDIISFEKQNYDINVKTDNIDLKKIKKYALAIANITGVSKKEIQSTYLSGTFQADFNAVGTPVKSDLSGYLKLNNTNISYKGLSKPVKNLNINAQLNKDKIKFQNSYGYLGDIKFLIGGNLSSKGIADLVIDIPRLNLNTIYSIALNSPVLEVNKNDFKDIRSISGYLKTKILVKGDLAKEVYPQVKADIINIAIDNKQLPAKLYIKTGNINIADEIITLRKLDTRLLSSKLDVNGKIKGLETQKLDLTAKGNLKASDAYYFLIEDQKPLVKTKGIIPMIALIKGKPDKMDLTAQLKFDNNNYVSLTADPFETNKIINLQADVAPTSMSIKDLSFNYIKPNTGFKNIIKESNLKKVIALEGKINDTHKLIQTFDNVKISSDFVKLRLREPVGTATAKLNLVLNQKADNPDIKGNIIVKEADIPLFATKANNLSIDFKDKIITATLPSLSIADSVLGLTAVINKNLIEPFVINDISIKSNYINIDKINQITTNAQKQMQQAQKGPTKPTQPADLPLLIKQGKFYCKNLIASNLPNNDVTFDFNIKELNKVNVENFQSKTASGTVNARANMNVKTTYAALNGTLKDIDVNQVLTATVNLPNEVIGKLNAKIDLSTNGITEQQQINNAVGNASFEVLNGKLVKLGSLQFLLGSFTRGINIFGTQGSTGTEDFDYLRGDVNLGNGILVVNKVNSSGRHLSLYSTGKIYIINNTADLVIMGRLSPKMQKIVAPIIKYSPQNLLGSFGFNILNTMTTNGAAGGVNYPDISNVPELSNKEQLQNNIFGVMLQGSLTDPRSVKSLKWLN